MNNDSSARLKRNIFIRVFSGIFWLILTVFIIFSIAGAILGLIDGTELFTAVMTVSETNNAWTPADGNVGTRFVAIHGGKVMLVCLVVWLLMSFFGIYPGVSKYKK